MNDCDWLALSASNAKTLTFSNNPRIARSSQACAKHFACRSAMILLSAILALRILPVTTAFPEAWHRVAANRAASAALLGFRIPQALPPKRHPADARDCRSYPLPLFARVR